MGSSVWASQRFPREPDPNDVQVEVTGMQFAWYFRYPGPDGKYGATSPKLMDPSAGGEAAVGLNTSDPAAKDDVVTGTMYMPVDREVDLSLRAVDVIHSFFVPSMRFKQDAVPGLNIHMHFRPTARSANTKLPAPNCAVWGITRCTAWCTWSARKTLTSGWRHGRRRNNKMATAATVHSHAPQGFIRKYIFSLDHKVIGIQYFFLALTAVFVGMFLSLLMRIHLVWPAAVLPLVGEIKPETYLSLLTMHGTIMVFFVLTTAPQGGFGNYFLPIQIGAPDMAFPVLNMLSFWTTFVAFVVMHRGVLCDRRRAVAWLDRLSHR
jgi:hypothetical protein